LLWMEWSWESIDGVIAIHSLDASSSFKFKQIRSGSDGQLATTSPCFGTSPDCCSVCSDLLIFDVSPTVDGQIDCLISSGETCIVWFSSVIKLPCDVPFDVTSSNVRWTSNKFLKLPRLEEFTENAPLL
jgi:hypothetical protein